MNRRKFLELSACAPILLNNACARTNSPLFKTFNTAANHRRPVELARYYTSPPGNTANPLRILFLGGTNFLGPASVHWLTLRGHDVTIFNRGSSAPDLFPNLDHVSGDRTNPESAYKNLGDLEPWDVVIDTWSKAPECVRDAAIFLQG